MASSVFRMRICPLAGQQHTTPFCGKLPQKSGIFLTFKTEAFSLERRDLTSCLPFDYHREKSPQTRFAKDFSGCFLPVIICAQATKNGAERPFLFGCLSSPTRKAAGSNPVGRTRQKASKSRLLCAFPGFLFFAFRFVNPVKNVDSRAFSLRRERTTGPCLPGACYDMIFP